MLKALELHGFKSFADKTRFEFPPGITVVVGPNGSGKSNIVDCIKWVLGEQSAKSLRGKEMADVIFKGSGTSGRKPMNTAEATLIFDNADGRLPVDAPEVHVTRRVYRSGEGEYLVNRQPARLKDIRDMFRGTGVGIDAYSLIEQGKVDRMLQATAKDRRAIFEEAAGISRFKAKKIEAQRRMERVEQNLLRLSDIVEEVENRLKTVRNQAGKARRYREYSTRLQQLRTQIALVDWRKLAERLSQLETELAATLQNIQAADAASQQLEARQLELEGVVQKRSEELHGCENQLAELSRRTIHEQATINHERARVAELEDETGGLRQNLLALSDKLGDMRSRLKAAQADVLAAGREESGAAEKLAAREADLAAIEEIYGRLREQVEAQRKELVAQLQASGTTARQVEAAEAQLVAARQAIAHLQQQLGELSGSEHELTEQLEVARAKEQEYSLALEAHQEQVKTATRELTENRNLHAARADDLAQLHSRRQGVLERAEVLEEFERTLEGIGTGVKEVLERAGISAKGSGFRVQGSGEAGHEAANSEFRIQNSESPWSLVRGVVADFVHTSVEHSGAIDIALGEAAQAIVVEGEAEQLKKLVVAAKNVGGRVVAIGVGNQPQSSSSTEYWVLSTLDQPATGAGGNVASAVEQISTAHHPLAIELTAEVVTGVRIIARADKLVDCPDLYRRLVTQLLGRTFVVQSLSDALRLRERAPAGARFVTQSGELVDEHGAIAFGPRQLAVSLVSRRSQLHAARLDLAVLDQQIADAQRETAHLKREVERHEQTVRQLFEAGQQLSQDAATTSVLAQSLDARHQQLARQRTGLLASLASQENDSQALQATLHQASQNLARAQQAARAAEVQIAGQEQDLAQAETRRHQTTQEVTAAKVALARCQQQRESQTQRLSQLAEYQRERERGIAHIHQQLLQCRERISAAEIAILQASAQIAELALQSAERSEQLASAMLARDEAAASRSALTDELAALRRQALKLRDREREQSLAAEQIRHEQKALADRLREDYSIELATLTANQLAEQSPEEIQERAAVEEEIASLRRKINQLGAVNLDALDELDELEQRFATLSSQHNDLTAAKQSLERIIHKINADSRRLFLETLEAIRTNFQALYRKAFGGGKADILLEENVDVLECGIDIVATPPGKPSFNNSLLSGGEKALTAVALLLAIFQFRPSPFCVLDEVDAPFDEANIGRFMDVLKDFLSWTRFVIVTHSKKTMTAATTLYGITMQESGVSKRVSVRFDDVTEDGHIRREALEREIPDESAENAA